MGVGGSRRHLFHARTYELSAFAETTIKRNNKCNAERRTGARPVGGGEVRPAKLSIAARGGGIEPSKFQRAATSACKGYRRRNSTLCVCALAKSRKAKRQRGGCVVDGSTIRPNARYLAPRGQVSVLKMIDDSRRSVPLSQRSLWTGSRRGRVVPTHSRRRGVSRFGRAHAPESASLCGMGYVGARVLNCHSRTRTP